MVKHGQTVDGIRLIAPVSLNRRGVVALPLSGFSLELITAPSKTDPDTLIFYVKIEDISRMTV